MKVFMKIAFVCTVLFSLLALWFYFYLRVKSKDVSNESPFNDIIGKYLILEKDVYIVRSKEDDFMNNISPVKEEKPYIINEDEETVLIIKKGTKITVKSANICSHGESGTYTKLVCVFHRIPYDVPFAYRWGVNVFTILDGSEPQENKLSFTFPKPIWVTRPEHNISKTYFLPEL